MFLIIKNNVENNKIILEKVLLNYKLITSSEHIGYICSFIKQNLDQNVEIEAGDEIEEHEFIDIIYFIEKIIQFRDNKDILEIFFSEILDYILEYLLKLDGEEEDKNEEYKKVMEAFEILRVGIIKNNFSKLIPIYSKLMKTSSYYSNVLDDLERIKSEIPKELNNNIIKALIKEIPHYSNIEDIKRTHEILNFLNIQHNNLIDENKTLLKEELIKLFENDDDQIIIYSLSFFNSFITTFSSDDNNDIFENLSNHVTPEKIEFTKNIFKLVNDNNTIINESVEESFIQKIANVINNVITLQNEEFVNVVISFLTYYIQYTNNSFVDLIIKPNNPQNILNANNSTVSIQERSSFCAILSLVFYKLSVNKQKEYLNLLYNLLVPPNVETISLAIDYLYKIFKDLDKDTITLSHLTKILQNSQLELSITTKFQMTEICFFYFDMLDETQSEKCISLFSEICVKTVEKSNKLLIDNWSNITDFEQKVKIVNSLINETSDLSIDSQNKYLPLIVNEINILPKDTLFKTLDNLGLLFKGTERKRTFYANILEYLKQSINEDLRNLYLERKVIELEKETDIDLCRNWFSVLNKFKKVTFEKDKRVNDLFFRLLNNVMVQGKFEKRPL